MKECAACQEALSVEPVPRWKTPLMFVGALLFCPCHLPATFAALAVFGASLGGGAWLLGHKVLVYGVFSAVYLVLLVALVRWFLGTRERERRQEQLHTSHEAAAAAST